VRHTLYIADVFRSAPFGGNQLAVLPDAVGISADGMQKIAREFMAASSTLAMCALGVEEDPATGSACAALVGAMVSKPDFDGMAYRLSIRQGVSIGRRSEIEAKARKTGSVGTSVSVRGSTASGEIDVPRAALVS
jgi:predicted PhzF superfamily epimerase YddE/YHI9